MRMARYARERRSTVPQTEIGPSPYRGIHDSAADDTPIWKLRLSVDIRRLRLGWRR